MSVDILVAEAMTLGVKAGVGVSPFTLTHCFASRTVDAGSAFRYRGP